MLIGSQDSSKYTDEDKEHMRKVVSYCKRHLAQEEHMKQEKTAEELEKTKSTRSLKNWVRGIVGRPSGCGLAANGRSRGGRAGEGKIKKEQKLIFINVQGHDPLKTLKGGKSSSSEKPKSSGKPVSKKTEDKPKSSSKPASKKETTDKPKSSGKPASKKAEDKPKSSGKPASKKAEAEDKPASKKAETGDKRAAAVEESETTKKPASKKAKYVLPVLQCCSER